MSFQMTLYKINWAVLSKEDIEVNRIKQTVSEVLQKFKPMAKGALLSVESTAFTLASGESVTLNKYDGGAALFLHLLLKLRLAASTSEEFYPLFGGIEEWFGDGGSSFYSFFVVCDNQFIAQYESIDRESAEKFLKVQEWSAGAVALQYQQFYETTNVGRGLALSGETHHVLTAKGRHDAIVGRLNSITSVLLWLTALTAINTLISIFSLFR